MALSGNSVGADHEELRATTALQTSLRDVCSCDHGDHGRGESVVEELGLFSPHGVHQLEREGHVRALVAEDPVGSRRSRLWIESIHRKQNPAFARIDGMFPTASKARARSSGSGTS
jgi:hypothetical protein